MHTSCSFTIITWHKQTQTRKNIQGTCIWRLFTSSVQESFKKWKAYQEPLFVFQVSEDVMVYSVTDYGLTRWRRHHSCPQEGCILTWKTDHKTPKGLVGRGVKGRRWELRRSKEKEEGEDHGKGAEAKSQRGQDSVCGGSFVLEESIFSTWNRDSKPKIWLELKESWF